MTPLTTVTTVITVTTATTRLLSMTITRTGNQMLASTTVATALTFTIRNAARTASIATGLGPQTILTPGPHPRQSAGAKRRRLSSGATHVEASLMGYAVRSARSAARLHSLTHQTHSLPADARIGADKKWSTLLNA